MTDSSMRIDANELCEELTKGTETPRITSTAVNKSFLDYEVFFLNYKEMEISEILSTLITAG